MTTPVPMLLTCPMCNKRHVDAGEFASKPHHTHACQHCGMVWRPALVPTVGVRFLPGFKDEAPSAASAKRSTSSSRKRVTARSSRVSARK